MKVPQGTQAVVAGIGAKSMIWSKRTTNIPITDDMTENEASATRLENKRLDQADRIEKELQEQTKKIRTNSKLPLVPDNVVYPPRKPTPDLPPILDEPPRDKEIRQYLFSRYQQLALDTMTSKIPEHVMYNYVSCRSASGW